MLPVLQFCLFALGAVLASFTGVIAERAYTGQTWARGRSRCNSCRKDLTARDLVPILSWAMHRGRCRQCGSKIAGIYTLAEATLGSLFLMSFYLFGFTLQLIPFLASLVILTFIVMYDIRHTIVPVFASNALIVTAAVFAILHTPNLHALLISCFYAIGIAAFFYALYYFSRGRAMGLGDTPVSFGLSLLTGHHALAGLLFSFWIGAVISIFILVFRKEGPKMGIEVPFVPFMAAGFLLAIFTSWNPLPF